MALTDKSKRFAQAKLRGMNNKESAIYAGYSQSTASQKGSALAKDPEIKNYIEKLTKIKAEKDPENTVNYDFVPTDTQKLMADINLMKDPLTFLLNVMSDDSEEMRTRIEAAKSALPYIHGKIGEKGKKENQKDAATHAASGRFSSMKAPTKRIN